MTKRRIKKMKHIALLAATAGAGVVAAPIVDANESIEYVIFADPQLEEFIKSHFKNEQILGNYTDINFDEGVPVEVMSNLMYLVIPETLQVTSLKGLEHTRLYGFVMRNNKYVTDLTPLKNIYAMTSAASAADMFMGIDLSGSNIVINSPENAAVFQHIIGRMNGPFGLNLSYTKLTGVSSLSFMDWLFGGNYLLAYQKAKSIHLDLTGVRGLSSAGWDMDAYAKLIEQETGEPMPYTTGGNYLEYVRSYLNPLRFRSIVLSSHVRTNSFFDNSNFTHVLVDPVQYVGNQAIFNLSTSYSYKYDREGRSQTIELGLTDGNGEFDNNALEVYVNVFNTWQNANEWQTINTDSGDFETAFKVGVASGPLKETLRGNVPLTLTMNKDAIENLSSFRLGHLARYQQDTSTPTIQIEQPYDYTYRAFADSEQHTIRHFYLAKGQQSSEYFSDVNNAFSSIRSGESLQLNESGEYTLYAETMFGQSTIKHMTVEPESLALQAPSLFMSTYKYLNLQVENPHKYKIYYRTATEGEWLQAPKEIFENVQSPLMQFVFAVEEDGQTVYSEISQVEATKEGEYFDVIESILPRPDIGIDKASSNTLVSVFDDVTKAGSRLVHDVINENNAYIHFKDRALQAYINLAYLGIEDIAAAYNLPIHRSIVENLPSLYLENMDVTSLEDLKYFKNLQSLSLVNLPLKDISPLLSISLKSLEIKNTAVDFNSDLFNSVLMSQSELEVLHLGEHHRTDNNYVDLTHVNTSNMAHLSVTGEMITAIDGVSTFSGLTSLHLPAQYKGIIPQDAMYVYKHGIKTTEQEVIYQLESLTHELFARSLDLIMSDILTVEELDGSAMQISPNKVEFHYNKPANWDGGTKYTRINGTNYYGGPSIKETYSEQLSWSTNPSSEKNESVSSRVTNYYELNENHLPYPLEIGLTQNVVYEDLIDNIQVFHKPENQFYRIAHRTFLSNHFDEAGINDLNPQPRLELQLDGKGTMYIASIDSWNGPISTHSIAVRNFVHHNYKALSNLSIAKGARTADYFESGAADIEGIASDMVYFFKESGIYTIYGKNSKGIAAVKTIKVEVPLLEDYYIHYSTTSLTKEDVVVQFLDVGIDEYIERWDEKTQNWSRIDTHFIATENIEFKVRKINRSGGATRVGKERMVIINNIDRQNDDVLFYTPVATNAVARSTQEVLQTIIPDKESIYYAFDSSTDFTEYKGTLSVPTDAKELKLYSVDMAGNDSPISTIVLANVQTPTNPTPSNPVPNNPTPSNPTPSNPMPVEPINPISPIEPPTPTQPEPNIPDDDESIVTPIPIQPIQPPMEETPVSKPIPQPLEPELDIITAPTLEQPTLIPTLDTPIREGMPRVEQPQKEPPVIAPPIFPQTNGKQVSFLAGILALLSGVLFWQRRKLKKNS